MDTFETGLKRASADGVITTEQAERLLPYLSGGHAGVPDESADDADRETPRFIRGFHDILITIGIVIALVGITGVASIFVTLPAIVVLAEILVRRQRLALPAVALTIATVVSTLSLTQMLIADMDWLSDRPMLYALTILTPLAIVLGLFAWRYRVPLALAGFFMALALIVLTFVFWALGYSLGAANLLKSSGMLVSAVLFAAALAFFALAMGYDFSDPARVTRRSDIAFWLHLVTAPALLYTTVSLMLGGREGFTIFYSSSLQQYAPLVTIPVIVVLMTIGVIIDRRAFVTSSLMPLVAALAALLRTGQMKFDSMVFSALLIVGILVLTIGVGWRPLRRRVVGFLPSGWRASLPPVV